MYIGEVVINHMSIGGIVDHHCFKKCCFITCVFYLTDSNKDLQLVRPSNETAVLAFTTVSSYNKCLRQIKVQYDVERSQNAGEILVMQSLFVWV